MNPQNVLTEQPTGIILAADVFTLEELQRLVKITIGVPKVVAIKIGFMLGLKYGLPAIVQAVEEIVGLPVIYDHQKAGTDIPQMGGPFAKVCRDSGVKGAIFFPQAGPKTLEAFVSAALDCDLNPIVGLAMTHKAYLKSDGGYIIDEAPEMIARAAVSFGVKDFVLPGNKPEIVASFAKGFLSNVATASIMMPGIGTQGGELAAAFQAAKPHRRFAIIGSAIYAASEPREALEAFIHKFDHE